MPTADRMNAVTGTAAAHETSSGGSWQAILTGPEGERAAQVIHEISHDLRRVLQTRGAAPELGEPPAADLGGGLAGCALFFHYADQVFPGRDFGEDRDTLIHRMAGAVESTQLTTNLVAGLAGIAWVLAHLQRSTCAAACEYELDELDEVIRRLVAHSPWTARYDLVSGLVGYAVYALERPGRSASLQVTASVLDRLEELVERTPAGTTWYTPPHLIGAAARDVYVRGWYNLGMAHGVSGVIGALARMVVEGADTARAPELLGTTIQWVLSQRLAPGSSSSFPGFIGSGRPTQGCRNAWCYGDAGVAAALLGASAATGTSEWSAIATDVLTRASFRSPDEAGVRDASVCHGAAGLAHIYNRAAQATGEPALLRIAREWYQRVLEHHEPEQGLGGFLYYVPEKSGATWRPVKGFLGGAAGIGLALLAGICAVDPQWDRVLLTNLRPIAIVGEP